MGQDHPKPDDLELDVRSAKLEDRLTRLQPRPPTFDSLAIRNAASTMDRDEKVTLPPEVCALAPLKGRGGKPGPLRSLQPLATIAVSVSCGAIAGALVTLFIVNASQEMKASQDASIMKTVQKQPSSRFIESPESAVADRKSQPPSVGASDDGNRESSVPRWSRGEWLVTAQLRHLHGPRTGHERPLKVRTLDGKSTNGLAPEDATEFDLRTVPSASSNVEPESPSRSRFDRSTDRKKLLEQLLRDSPTFRL